MMVSLTSGTAMAMELLGNANSLEQRGWDYLKKCRYSRQIPRNRKADSLSKNYRFKSYNRKILVIADFDDDGYRSGLSFTVEPTEWFITGVVYYLE